MFDYIYADFVLFLNVHLNSFCGLLISSTDSNDCFTKQDAVKQAEVLGVGNKTIDRWLQKSINCHDIQHVAHGIYSKIIDETAPIFSRQFPVYVLPSAYMPSPARLYPIARRVSHSEASNRRIRLIELRVHDGFISIYYRMISIST